MVSKVFSFKLQKILSITFPVISLILVSQTLKADDYKFQKSYFGSILSGQIAC